jgi:ApaG protein
VSKHRYEETTRDITIAVEPNFLEDQSEPEEGRFLWSYHVTIENRSEVTVQLLSRYWRITDARGRVREVRGEGVIGEQPVIAPGRVFEYTSGAPLETASGFMTGTYRMRASTGESFEVGIPMFALESPYAVGQMH